MPQRPLTERQERYLDLWWIPSRPDRQVGALEMGRGPDSGQDVGGQGQMQHLLLDDVDESGLPGLDSVQLVGREPLVDRA